MRHDYPTVRTIDGCEKENGDTDRPDGGRRAPTGRDECSTPCEAPGDGDSGGGDRFPPDTDAFPPDSDGPPAAVAYRWLRVVKLLLGLVVSLLTALKLLGLLP